MLLSDSLAKLWLLKSINQLILFLTWPKQQTTTSKTTKGMNSYKGKTGVGTTEVHVPIGGLQPAVTEITGFS